MDIEIAPIVTGVVEKQPETGNAATGGWRGRCAPANGRRDKDRADDSGNNRFESEESLYGPLPESDYRF